MTPGPASPRDGASVPVRVQVIDLEPRVVDLMVPTYLPMHDVTQRIARDAGLQAFWEDGTRRHFTLRARGRVLGEHERLRDVGVVPYELLHLLPEPRPEDGVQERPLGLDGPPTMPPSRASAVLRSLMSLVWAVLWWVAAVAAPTFGTAFWGALGMGWLVVGMVHGWRPGRQDGLAPSLIWLPLALVGIGLTAWGQPDAHLALRVVGLGLGGGLVGLTLARLTWMGPVEPLPEDAGARAVASSEARARPPCAVCEVEIAVDVLVGCPYGCGRTFHRGCLRHKERVAQGPGCAVCGAELTEG